MKIGKITTGIIITWVVIILIVGLFTYKNTKTQMAYENARAEYYELMTDYNNGARDMYKMGNLHCGIMVVSCSEDGYITMEGSLSGENLLTN